MKARSLVFTKESMYISTYECPQMRLRFAPRAFTIDSPKNPKNRRLKSGEGRIRTLGGVFPSNMHSKRAP